ncbi:MAG: BatD family protein [Planctomycetes bacterium]|nr:BatD family protein [Planctomycetota bacterium]MCB9903548.1 BatD family protein [Planctomycetota bacterium]
MKTTRRLVLALCCLAWIAGLGLALPSAAQADGPKVTAQLSSGLVRLGTGVRVNLHAQDVEDARVVDIPEVPGLKLAGISRPSHERRESWINGRRTVSTSIRWVVVYDPIEEGDYVIPPIELEVDGERVKTRELSLTVKRDLQGEELGYMEWIDLPDRIYEGESFRLRLRFGWDVRTSVNHANLMLPWWDELPNAIEAPDPADKLANPVEVYLNNRQRVRVQDLGEQKVGDKSMRLLELDRRYIATRSGAIELPQSFLEFGMVEQRMFSERKNTNYVGLPETSIEVRALPTDGQPFDFSGGVGRFFVGQSVDRRSVDVGESIKFGVEWSGPANLEFFTAPDPARLEAFDGFRVYGRTDEFLGDRRRVVYDLAPVRSDIEEIPPLPLWVFDTQTEQYTSVDTEPIAIRVRALPGAVGLSGETSTGPVLDIGDVQTEPEGPDGPAGPSDTTLIAVPALMLGGWFALRTGVRRAGDPDAPAARARRTALRRLRRELNQARTASDQSLAFRRFLGARTGESPEAWEGRPMLAWFEEHADANGDVQKRDTAQRAAALVRDIDESVWAGSNAALERDRIEGLARELQGCLL